MVNFDDAALLDVLDKVVSYGQASGRFDQVNQHEPKNAPGNGLVLAVWIDNIGPVRSSGLPMTSGRIVLTARIYTSFNQQPFDSIDSYVTSAVCDLMGALSGDFNFGEVADVRCVDLLGAYGNPLSAQAGYVEIDRHIYRVMTLFAPIIINDMFEQVA